MPSNTPGVTNAQLDGFIPVVVAAEALATLQPRRGISRFLNTKYENVLSEAGQTVQMPFLGNVGPARTKTQSTKYQVDTPVGTKVEATLQHIYKRVRINETASLFSRPEILMPYAMEAILQVLQDIDRAAAEEGAEFTENQTQTANIYQNIVDARTKMINRNAPVVGPYIIVAGPALAAAAYKDEDVYKFISTGQQLQIGANTLPQISNLNAGFFETQIIAKEGSPEKDVNFMMHQDAIGILTRPMGTMASDMGLGVTQGVYTDPETNLSIRVGTAWNHDYGAFDFTAEALFAVKKIRDELGVTIKTA
jgi:hypothetical protein